MRALRDRGLAGGVAAALVAMASSVLLATPASAAATTHKVDLGLTGVATAASPIGGSIVGVRPGDSVSLRAATVPSAGLEKIPVLGGLLDTVLGSGLGAVSGYQVILHLPANFPGGKRDVKMGACSGATKQLDIAFPTKGTYNFTWTAHEVNLLCLLPTNLGSLYGNQLIKAGVALNAKAEWIGSIVVSDNPPKGGLSVQLPGVSVAPSLPVLGQLPTIGVPGVVLPTLGVPELPTNLPSVAGNTAPKPASKPGVIAAVVRGAAYSGQDLGLLFPEDADAGPQTVAVSPTATQSALEKSFTPVTMLAVIALFLVSTMFMRTQRRPATVKVPGRHARK